MAPRALAAVTPPSFVGQKLRCRPSLWLPLLVAAALWGCQPHIGDECSTSVDCSQAGERLCDVTQPGGYCTVFNCEPGGCPEDSVCIAFGARLSSVAECSEGSGFSRFQRSFCMANCSEAADCRSGYACVDVGAPGNRWNAVVVDAGASGRVCAVPQSANPVPDERAHGVCDVPEAESDDDSESGVAGSAG